MVRGPRGDSYLCCNNVDAGTVKCLLRECKEVGAEPPRPECERFRRHYDGEWLLIDACRAQAAGASPGVNDVTAMKAARRTIRNDVRAHPGDGASSVVCIVLGAVMCGCRSSKRRNEQADRGEGNEAVRHDGDPKCLQFK